MKSNKLILFIFLFLLSQIVYASDFIVEVSNTKQTTNPCTSTQFSLKVSNTGVYANTYSLNILEHHEYVTVSENSFNLNPGETKQLFVFANFPCEVYGTQNFELLLKSTSSGTKANIPLTVNILKAYDYSISTLNSYEICELLNSTLVLSIKNNAGVNNFYNLKAKGVDFVTPRKTNINLVPGQESHILLNLKPMQESIGVYDLTIISKSNHGEITKKLITKINVIKCLDPVVIVPTDKSICAEKSSFLFEVINNGSFEETFNFEISPDFITLENNNLTLNSRDSKLLTLTINPPSEDNDYLVNLKTTLSDRPVALSQAFNLRVFSPETCHKVYLQKHKLRVGYDEETNDLQVASSGFRYSNYQVSYSGPEWASVMPSSFLLEPGHNFSLLITTNALNDTPPGIYQLNISLESDNGFLYQESIKLKLGPGFELEQVLLVIFIVLVALFALAILILLFKPKKKDQVLKEFVKSEKKVKKSKVRKYPKSLFALLGLMILILIMFGLYNYAPTIIQSYNLTLGLVVNDSVDSINVSLNDSIFVDETIFNFTEQLYTTSVQFININAIKDYINLYTKEISMGILAFFALLVSIGAFLNLKNKRWLFILLVALIIFSLSSQVKFPQLSQNETRVDFEEESLVKELVLTINTSMYDDIKGTFLYHEFEKNIVYEINLSEFFFDPEGGPLSFKTTNPTDIVVTIFDDLLLLSPKFNWTGINSIAVIATDDQGATTTSPEVILVIVEEKPISFDEFKEWVKTNIDLILFTLILFVIFVIIVINSSSKK